MTTNDQPDDDLAETAKRLKAIEEANRKKGIPKVDYGKLTVEALNRHTSSPEFTARYKKWLMSMPYETLTPVAKADLDEMLAAEKEAKAKAKAGTGGPSARQPKGHGSSR